MHTQLLYPGASPDDGTGTVLRDAAFILNNMLLRLAGSSWRQPVLSTLSAPPLTPNHQQRWLIGPAPTGAFAGKEGQIAEWVGTPPGAAPVNAWSFEPPTEGAFVIDIAAASLLRWDGSAWVSEEIAGPPGPTGPQGPVGAAGPKGDKGDKGDPASVAGDPLKGISVATAGTTATVSFNGVSLPQLSAELAASAAHFVVIKTDGTPGQIHMGLLVPNLAARTAPTDGDHLITSAAAGGLSALGKTTIAQFFNGRTLQDSRLIGIIEAKQLRSDVSATATLPVYGTQNTYHYRLTGNATLTLPTRPAASNTIIGITLIIDQDGTGGRTLTLNAPAGETIKWHGGTMGGIATGPNARTRIALSAAQGETRWDAAIVYKEA